MNLLLEIGTEEIPAGYIGPALRALSENLLQKLTQMRIAHGKAKTYGTPRRLAVVISDVAGEQTSVTTAVLGPPKKVAYDAGGKPTLAAEKFAEKVGVPLSEIAITETPKGAYLSAQKREEGGDTLSLLKEMLPQAILSLPFPKTMRWGDLRVSFARPIIGIVALLGEKEIPFSIGNIESGRLSAGHPFMHPEPIKLADSGQYVETLEKVDVYVDIAARRKMVEAEINRAAKSLGGKVLPDPALLDIVTNLVEFPIASAGRFDEVFLDLPREILITAMREHQKYFAVIDEKGDLLPCFIAVNNTRTRDPQLVASGHERVLRARLADAQFFYQSDLEESFRDWVEKLKGVLFQAKLGSMHAKVIRVQKLAGFLAELISQDKKLKKQVLRAALLCKADLVSQVVGEFPSLQGVMGRVYAAMRKEDDPVAAAIEEHYRPTYSGGPLPETTTGAVLSLADKIDNICGCFSVGLVPTGASDPYALRRQGIGLIQIMLKDGFTFSLQAMLEKNVKLFGARSIKEIRETTGKVLAFLRNRMAHLLEEEGFSKDVIAAVIEVSIDNVPAVWQKVRALEDLKSAPDFEPLAVAFKRVVNIIKQARGSKKALETGEVDVKRFEHKSETALYEAYQKVAGKVAASLEKDQFAQALSDIASLRDAVDAFFEDVMVMAEDPDLRKNRLALLGQISLLFSQLADFSKIAT